MNCFSVSVFFCYFACKITNMGRIIGIISVVLTLSVLASCTDKSAMRQRLDYVSQCNRADTVFTEEWLPTVDSLVNYFDRHGNTNEKMMAHYLKGRVHHDMAISILGKLGTVTPRIKQSVVVKRYSTLYPLDKYQYAAVEHAFDRIIEEINK